MVTGGALLPVEVHAATISVSGSVFWDRDNDGVRDAGEPGVPGVRVHRSNGNQAPSATTDSQGRYTLTGLTPSSSGYLLVESGWFRSQCAKLTCAAGPGRDNDFATANAFIRYPLAQLTGTTTNLNVGVLPDWPGSSAAPPAPVAGVAPANAVDVASRLSWTSSTCPGGKYLICRAGDTMTVTAQVMNQGTTTLTGIRGVLDLPASDRFATGNASRDVTLSAVASAPTITGLAVGAIDPTTQSVPITLQGSLPPGGEVKIVAKATVAAGPGTPGCTVSTPTSRCPTAEPQGAPLTFAVTHIDQSGDPDSFGPDCPAGAAITTCATGIHDKQAEPDEIDPVGHNVDPTLGVSSSYDLSARLLALRTSAPGSVAPGSTAVLRAVALDTGPATGLPGWKLTVVLPKSTKPVLPAKHALRTCSKGTTSAGFPMVTCTGKGPLGPGVASFAMDVSLTIPVSWKAGARLNAIAYVTPDSAQGAETNPAGAAPTAPTVDADQTASNNDASLVLPVRP